MQENCNAIVLFLRIYYAIILCILMHYVLHLYISTSFYVFGALCHASIELRVFCALLLYALLFILQEVYRMVLSLRIFSTSGRRLYCDFTYFIFGPEKRFGFCFEFQFFSISWKHNYHLLKNPCEEKFAIFTMDSARNFYLNLLQRKNKSLLIL